MRPCGASPSHPPLDSAACGFFLHLLSIVRSLHLPAFVSLSSPSSFQNWDLSVAKSSTSGLRHPSPSSTTKAGGALRAVHPFPRRHDPFDARDPPRPPDAQREPISSDSPPRPSEDCLSHSPASPGFHGTEIRALTGDAIRPGPIPRFKRMDGVAKGIKAASGVVKGLKDANGVLRKLEAPIGDLFLGFGAAGGIVVGLKAAKLVTKSLQISKGIVSTLQSRNLFPRGETFVVLVERLSFLLKGFKAFDGAFTLLHFAVGVASQRELARLLNWNSFQKGYKLSKSVVNVLEVILGLKVGIISSVGSAFYFMKKATEGVGIMVKAAFLSKEIYMVLLKGLDFLRGNVTAFETLFRDNFESNSNARLHRDIPKQILYIRSSRCTFDISLTVANPGSSCSDLRGSFALFLLVDSLSQAYLNFYTCCYMETDHSYIFSLAIPLP